MKSCCLQENGHLQGRNEWKEKKEYGEEGGGMDGKKKRSVERKRKGKSHKKENKRMNVIKTNNLHI